MPRTTKRRALADDLRSGPSRRALLASLAYFGLGTAAAHAQSGGSWMDGLPGFGRGTGSAREVSEKRERPVEVLNDLRTDATPWRSDQMVDNIEAAIQRYQQIAQRGGWPAIPTGRLLRIGENDERVVILRRRLMMSGDLSRNSGGDSYTFDDDLEQAVKRFQERHGLRVTGRAELSTISQMNISANSRLEQLKLNQRRIRELLQTRVEDRYVLVNAAAFQLEAVEGYEVRQRHRVIVGKPERQTPVVKATIRALNFFPYWNVPQSVATLDLIPRLQKEPQYLAEGTDPRVQWLQRTRSSTRWRSTGPVPMAKIVHFRQDPGPQNALGLVRIDMPNSETVYMHDTPMKPLFNQRSRPFSAGCVRVQDVFKLVEWIARYEIGWDKPGRAEDVIAGGQPLDVTLTRPLPVYFTYVTAWAEADGRIEFRPRRLRARWCARPRRRTRSRCRAAANPAPGARTLSGITTDVSCAAVQHLLTCAGDFPRGEPMSNKFAFTASPAGEWRVISQQAVIGDDLPTCSGTCRWHRPDAESAVAPGLDRCTA